MALGAVGVKKMTQYQTLMDKLLKQPIWVKQAIYMDLQQNLSACSVCSILCGPTYRPIQLYKPILTTLAEKFFSPDDKMQDEDMKAFLEACSKELNILEIAQVNKWNLVYTLELMFNAIDLGFVEEIRNYQTQYIGLYLSDKISLATLLNKLGSLSDETLHKCLVIQQESEIGSTANDLNHVLVKHGGIDQSVVDYFYILKISARKNLYMLDDSAVKEEVISILRREIDTLLAKKSNTSELINYYKKEANKSRQVVKELSNKLENCTRGMFRKVCTAMF